MVQKKLQISGCEVHVDMLVLDRHHSRRDPVTLPCTRDCRSASTGFPKARTLCSVTRPPKAVLSLNIHYFSTYMYRHVMDSKAFGNVSFRSPKKKLSDIFRILACQLIFHRSKINFLIFFQCTRGTLFFPNSAGFVGGLAPVLPARMHDTFCDAQVQLPSSFAVVFQWSSSVEETFKGEDHVFVFFLG